LFGIIGEVVRIGRWFVNVLFSVATLLYIEIKKILYLIFVF